jgi:hypothetical protein
MTPRTLAAGSLLITVFATGGAARTVQSTPTGATQPPRNGAHDFDFELGEWTTHLKRLQHPLTGSTTWVEYTGTTTVRPILGGRANIAELVVDGPAGRIEGAALRLYSPQSRQWTLNYFNAADGLLTPSMTGEFRDGRGVFHGQDTLGGRSILVRFVITKAGSDTYRFEQSFSADGGETWELNWVAIDTKRSRPGRP